MNSKARDHDSRDKNLFVSISSLLAILCCIGTTYLAVKAGSFEYEAAGDPAGQIKIGLEGVPLLKWMMICDMFGFYLPTIPALLFLALRFRETEREFALKLAVISGILYALLGSLGAAILSILWPELTTTYATTQDSSVKELTVQLFKFSSSMVMDGIWGRLEYTLSMFCYVGIGVVTWSRSRAFAALSVVTGLCAGVSSFGKMFDMFELAGYGLYGILVAVPLWYACVAMMALRPARD